MKSAFSRAAGSNEAPRLSAARALLLLSGIASILLGARAQADAPSFELPLIGPTTFSLTSTTTLRYRGNNYNSNPKDDDFGSLYQRFDAALQSDEFRLETRLDAFIPTTVFEDWRCSTEEADFCVIGWDVRPERIALRWEHEEWRLELGDSQLVLGRGIALAFRKVDLLAVDTALRGAHVRYEGSNFRFRLHGGVANPQNQDPISLQIRPDPEDWVTASQVGVTIPGPVAIHLGVHGAYLLFQDDPPTGSPRTGRQLAIGGWSAEAPALFEGRLSLYVEANALRRTWELSGQHDSENGRAVYGSAQIQGDELTVLLEWADYRNFIVAPHTLEADEWRIYGGPPTLEYEGPQLLRGVGNRRGGAIRIDYAFLPGPWSFGINQSLFGIGEHPEDDPWNEVLVSHSWLTLARRQEYGDEWVWSMNWVAGFRQEQFIGAPDTTAVKAGDVDRQMVHGQAELTLGSNDHSFDLSVDQRWERWFVFSGYREFQVGGASVTYSWGVPLALTLTLRWSDFRPDEVKLRSERDYNFLGGFWYPSLEARWSFDPGTFLKLFLGSTPGGQICSGGVCRTVPAFEGAMLQFIARL